MDPHLFVDMLLQDFPAVQPFIAYAALQSLEGYS